MPIYDKHPHLSALSQQQLIWQASRALGADSKPPCPSGHPKLDQALGGGLPQGGLILMDTQAGYGELRLLQQYLSKSLGERLLAWVAPPWALSSEALLALGLPLQQQLLINTQSREEALWATEQCLRSGACAHVMLWELGFEQQLPRQSQQPSPHSSPQRQAKRFSERSRKRSLGQAEAKRLKLAAAAGDACAIVFRQQHPNNNSLAATLAMTVSPHPQGLNLQINKRQRGWPIDHLHIDLQKQWPDLCEPTRPRNVLPMHAKALQGKKNETRNRHT